jgi:hypothetical protein
MAVREMKRERAQTPVKNGAVYAASVSRCNLAQNVEQIVVIKSRAASSSIDAP